MPCWPGMVWDVILSDMVPDGKRARLEETAGCAYAALGLHLTRHRSPEPSHVVLPDRPGLDRYESRERRQVFLKAEIPL